MRSLQDQPACRNDQYNSTSKGKAAGVRPHTVCKYVYAATDEEDVEEFILKGWPAGNASQPATGFQNFTEATKPDISLTSAFSPH